MDFLEAEQMGAILQFFFITLLLVPVCWAACEGIGAAVHVKKKAVGLVMGPALGIFVWVMGWLPLPTELPNDMGIPFPATLVLAGFVGLLTTFGARGFNFLAKKVGVQLPSKNPQDS